MKLTVNKNENPILTLTAGELIKILSEYPQEVPIIAEWEDTWNAVTEKNMRITSAGLVIDVETY